MKVTINAEKNKSNAINHNGKKELLTRLVAIAKKGKEWHEVVDFRAYMSYKADGMAPMYGALWVRGNGLYLSGKGSASGCGYHKASAVLSDCLSNAGITLDQDIDGRGNPAMHDAIKAVCKKLGFNDVYIVE